MAKFQRVLSFSVVHTGSILDLAVDYVVFVDAYIQYINSSSAHSNNGCLYGIKTIKVEPLLSLLLG